MARVVIKENNVFALETRTGLYVIAQALIHRTLVFFNLFTTDPQSFNADLNKAEILCCVTPTRDFYQNTDIMKLKIKPADGVAHYREQNRITFELMTTYEKVKVYEGTEDELTILAMMGELRLVDWQIQTLKHLSKKKDLDIINAHMLDCIGVYGELNERLYLSYRYGKFVEPLKELLIGNVQPEFRVYFQIASQQITEEDWKHLPIEDVL